METNILSEYEKQASDFMTKVNATMTLGGF